MGYTKGNRRSGNHIRQQRALKHRISGLLKHAYEHHVNQNFEEAERGYQAILRLSPNHPDANHLLGLLVFEQGDYDLATNLVGIALKQEPENLSFLGNLANIKKTVGEYDNAISLYQRLIQLYPHCTEAHIALGDVYRENNQRQLAILQYRRALSLEPDQSDCHYALGSLYKTLQIYEEAEICFQRVLRIDRYHFDAHYQLGLSLLLQDKHKEAISTFERLIELNGNYISAINKLAECYEALLEPEKARATYQKTLAIDPDNSLAYHKLGSLAKSEGNFEQAIHYFQQAIEKRSCDFHALQNLGHTYHIMGNYDKALVVYQEAQRFQPNHAILNYYIAALTHKTPEKAPLQYVESLYDDYAQQLQKQPHQYEVDYPISKQILDALIPWLDSQTAGMILDLGCGEGTFAQLFKEKKIQSRIIGVDISEKMLELARRTSSYHELFHKDFVLFLKTQTEADLIIAADSLSYLGKLNVFLVSAYHALKTNGILAFSIEQSQKAPYLLNPNGRFAHHDQSLEFIGRQLGFTLIHKEDTLFPHPVSEPTLGKILIFKKN